MKYRKKPVVIEAVKFTGDTKPFTGELQKFANAICCLSHNGTYGGAHIHTLEGEMIVNNNDWVIQGIKGEFYPCKPNIFEATYEPVEI